MTTKHKLLMYVTDAQMDILIESLGLYRQQGQTAFANAQFAAMMEERLISLRDQGVDLPPTGCEIMSISNPPPFIQSVDGKTIVDKMKHVCRESHEIELEDEKRGTNDQ